uniref:Uncharacterized protein n=1 Tax=Arundo donax TaxID=35708 RepID=A0A0A9D327_ARUDO
MCFVQDDCRILWTGIDRPDDISVHAISVSSGELLTELLEEFQELFGEPQGLPTVRLFTHRIRLQLGTEAVAVRPYRYAHIQKDELER